MPSRDSLGDEAAEPFGGVVKHKSCLPDGCRFIHGVRLVAARCRFHRRSKIGNLPRVLWYLMYVQRLYRLLCNAVGTHSLRHAHGPGFGLLDLVIRITGTHGPRAKRPTNSCRVVDSLQQ